LLFRAEERLFAVPRRDFAGATFLLTARDFDFVARPLVFEGRAFAVRDFFGWDFFAPGRAGFPGRVDLSARFAAGTAARTLFTATLACPAACCAVRLTLGMTGSPLDAALPSAAPITPPATAPTGPPTAPKIAPVAAPAAVFGIGGISIFSLEPDCEVDWDSSALDSDFFAVDSDSFAMKLSVSVFQCEGKTN
jgi:hypothetical protein